MVPNSQSGWIPFHGMIGGREKRPVGGDSTRVYLNSSSTPYGGLSCHPFKAAAAAAVRRNLRSKFTLYYLLTTIRLGTHDYRQ